MLYPLPQRQQSGDDGTPGGGAACRAPGTAGTIARLGAAPSLRRGRVPTLYAQRPRRPVGPVPTRALRPAPRPELWGRRGGGGGGERGFQGGN